MIRDVYWWIGYQLLRISHWISRKIPVMCYSCGKYRTWGSFVFAKYPDGGVDVVCQKCREDIEEGVMYEFPKRRSV
jgi:hypothetical protein